MDWRFNTIAFDKLQEGKFFQADFGVKKFELDTDAFLNSEYAIIWHLKKKLEAFDSLPKSDKLLFIELNLANINDLSGIAKYKNLKRLELHYCLKLLNDRGIAGIKGSLMFLHINQSKKFEFTEELLQLKHLRVLYLNDCAPIDNLGFLDNFPHLIDFRFVNTTIRDGNLNPILDHPTIRSVGFLNKRHYNYKSEDIKEKLNEKFNNEDNRTYLTDGKNVTFRYDY
ncbi:hypothetical protein [Dysgonomonas massiliensis]|uniref:hypothetical protein n=1 Tax=Dysgonomonas massiliensis TaxID=2040292 RepID=UPI000C7853E4|nr:hypothetical protein [Dysgonomonas massiliensis]